MSGKFNKVDVEVGPGLGGVDNDNETYGLGRQGGFVLTSSMVWAFRNAMTAPSSNVRDHISYFLHKLAKSGTSREAAKLCLEAFGMDDAGVGDADDLLAGYDPDRYR